jgi:hypothetical protein
MITVDLVANGLGLLGVILLSAPVLYANKYARLVVKLRAAGTLGDDERSSKLDSVALEALQEHQTKWTRWKSFCLLLGTTLTGLSYVVGLIKAAVA